MKRVNQAIVAALGLAVTGVAFARFDSDRYPNSYFDYARVISVDRIVQPGSTQPVTRQQCRNEPSDEYHPGRTYQQTDPPQVMANGDRVTRTETVDTGGYYTHTLKERCDSTTDYVSTPQTVAFNVVYRYDGQDYQDQLNFDPGARVRVHVDNGYVQVAQ